MGATRGGRGYDTVYDEMMDLLRKLSHENVALKEKLRRERELLTEAKQAAAESATQHQRVTMGFMTKLRSLQKRSETLYDDQCASEWRKLQQALKSWTGRTFKDESAMSKMTLERYYRPYVESVHTSRVLLLVLSLPLFSITPLPSAPIHNRSNC